jgi:hypothetical protein
MEKLNRSHKNYPLEHAMLNRRIYFTWEEEKEIIGVTDIEFFLNLVLVGRSRYRGGKKTA